MMEQTRSWWGERTPREQALLALLALIAIPAFLYYGVSRPLDAMMERAQGARDGDARALADTLRMANRIIHADRPVRDGRQIEVQVREEAERAGFTVAGVARDGDGALLTIDAVRSEPFFAWIATQKQRRGLIVTRLAARPNGDSTLSVSVRFQRAR